MIVYHYRDMGKGGSKDVVFLFGTNSLLMSQGVIDRRCCCEFVEWVS